MADSVQGPGGMTPHEQYVEAFKKSANLFEDALKEHQSTPLGQKEKREQFREVMNKALKVMSETAMETCKKSGQRELEQKLEKDYQKFIEDTDKNNKDGIYKGYHQLLDDIEALKQSFGNS